MSELSRREVLAGASLLTGGILAAGGPAALAASQAPSSAPAGAAPAATGPYTLSPLPYDYADLEPHIDAQTMKLHHDIHHAGYVKNANAAFAELDAVRRQGGADVQRVRAITDALTFNLAGHALHEIFWTNMKRDGGGEPAAGSEIGKLIQRDFGTFAAFSAQFSAAAAQVQASGWGIAAYDPLAERVLVLQAEKHQNLAVWGVTPVLVIDVWEHAYYLKYQNRRTDYIKAWWNVVNWDDADKRLQAAMKAK